MVRKAVIREPAQEVMQQIAETGLENDNEFQGLTDFLAELTDSSSAQVTIYRDVKGRATGAYLFRCTPGEFSVSDVMDKLRDEYGGGSFRVGVWANGQRLKNTLIEVEPPIKSSFDFLNKNQPQQQPQQSNDLAAMLMQIQDSNRASQDMMRESMMQMQQENTRTLLELFKSNAQGSSEKTSTAEMLQLLTIARQLSAPNEIAQGPEKMLEMFFEGMKQGREMATDSGGEKNILQTALETFGPAIAELAGKVGQQQPQQMLMPQRQNMPQRELQKQPPPPLQNPIEGQPLPVPESPPMGEVDSAIVAAQPYIVMLVNAARQDADPEVYANLLMDQIPAQGLREYLENDLNFSMLLGYFPPEANAELRPWFDTLREMALELLHSEVENAGDTNADGQLQHAEDVPRGTGSALSADPNAPA